MALVRLAFGVLVLALGLVAVDEGPGTEAGTTRSAAHERPVERLSSDPSPRTPSFSEAAALKAVDENTSAAEVAASAATRVDPMFRHCRDARMRGLGPYERGAHVEYYWYPDRDLDGTACEPH